MNAFVVSGLVKRRAELAGEIERAHEALHKMVLDLENLDATILQFEPDFRVEAIKPKAFRPPKDWSNRGQMSRIILSILRQAAEPLTSRDIALEFARILRRPKRGQGKMLAPDRNARLLKEYDAATQKGEAVAALARRLCAAGRELGNTAGAIETQIRKLVKEREKRERAAAVEARRWRMATRGNRHAACARDPRCAG